jgi:hypothetical protein
MEKMKLWAARHHLYFPLCARLILSRGLNHKASIWMRIKPDYSLIEHQKPRMALQFVFILCLFLQKLRKGQAKVHVFMKRKGK